MPMTECIECGDAFEYEYITPPRDHPPERCPDCAERKAMRSLARVEPPKGGWPMGSDMDRI